MVIPRTTEYESRWDCGAAVGDEVAHDAASNETSVICIEVGRAITNRNTALGPTLPI